MCFFVGETHNTAGCPLLNWMVDYCSRQLVYKAEAKAYPSTPPGNKNHLHWATQFFTMPRPISKVQAAASAKWKSNTAPRSNATIAKKHKIPAARVGVACIARYSRYIQYRSQQRCHWTKVQAQQMCCNDFSEKHSKTLAIPEASCVIQERQPSMQESVSRIRCH